MVKISIPPPPPNNKGPVPPPPRKLPPPPPRGQKNLAYTKEDIFSIEANLDLPHALDLEEVILGALLIDSRAIEIVAPKLKADFFYDKRNKIIYTSIKSLYDDNKGVDLLTVVNHLKEMNKLINVGGELYLVNLSQRVASSAHIEHHMHVVIQKYILRELIYNSSDVIDECYNYNPDVFLLLDSIEANVNKLLSETARTDDMVSNTDAVAELKEKMEMNKRGEVSGIMSGIEKFDEWSGGFQRRELITIAARPGMGKTTAVLSMVKKASLDNNIPMAFFSLEMAIADLKARLASGELNIEYSEIRKGTITEEQFKLIDWYYNTIDGSKLYLVERMTVFEQICKKIRDLVINKGIKMAVIDYVQLIKMARSGSDRAAELSEITRGLKALANELNIPIIIIAQLSREADKRPNKRPQLSDLKSSGSIEEDSDMVAFLLRKAYYDDKEGTMQLPKEVTGKCEWIIAKGRSTGTRNFWTFLDFEHFDFRSS